MASEIKCTFLINRTLTYGVVKADGSVRTAAGTSLPQSATVLGNYVADNASIVAGDFVRVEDSVYGYIGGAEYFPSVTISPPQSTSITTIETGIATLITGQNKVNNNYPDLTEDERSRILYI